MFDGISVNGKSVIGSSNAVIDTGTTMVVGDTQSVQDFYDQIPGSKYVSKGFWTSAFMNWLSGRSTD